MSVIIDPIYGFIDIPNGLLRKVIDHPYFQRLDRIRQLGTSGFVYPGAQHTRKQHSLGAYYLVTEALRTLAQKGHFLFDSEIEATQATLLMHDLGHGPYSHVLESTFMRGVSHEEISFLMMCRMNETFNAELTLALQIFKNKHPKHFLHELLSSQLDMDRLDYLCRDSFYTGVREGNVGAERIIKMLDVKEDRLVINTKGIYSVENYLMARRLMYWQVYLHKTTVAAEEVLRSALTRAKELAMAGESLLCSPALSFFLYNDVTQDTFHHHPETLDVFAQLDDSDVLSALKVWTTHKDKTLSILASNFIHRRLFKVEVADAPFATEEVEDWKKKVAASLDIPAEETHYFVKTRCVSKEMYSVTAEGIELSFPDDTIHDISDISHIIHHDAASIKDEKYYLFHQRT